jgi:hypothetical protein
MALKNNFFCGNDDNKAMKAEEEESIVKYNLRLPEGLYGRICAQAKANMRSINNEIIMILRGHFLANDGAVTYADIMGKLEEIEAAVFLDRPAKPAF